jgi:hypothetical protein
MRGFAVAAALFLASCSAPLPVQKFAGSGLAFDPLAFFTGHETSWGVEENRAGQPIAIVTTDCTGVATGPDSLRMVQVLHVGQAAPMTRIWTLTRTGPGQLVATANDMAGSTTGIAAGRAFHLRWVLEVAPGDTLKNVTMDQWMYQMSDGAVVVRTVVTKLGIRLVEITEQFEKS